MRPHRRLSHAVVQVVNVAKVRIVVVVVSI